MLRKNQTFEKGVEKTERNLGKHKHTVSKRIKNLVTEQERQYAYDVTKRRFRVTIVAVKK